MVTYPYSDCCPNLPDADPGCDDGWCCTHEMRHDMTDVLRHALDEAERMASAAHDEEVQWIGADAAEHGCEESGRHIEAWTASRVLRLIARDRALLVAHASTDRNVAEHVVRCGPDLCACRDYLAATTALQILTSAVEAAARFWLPERAP